MFIFIFFILFSSVISIDNKCDEKLFILISTQTVYLYDFDTTNDYSPSIIYKTKLNSTIEYGLFNKRLNTIVLLINQFNQTYSIVLLNTYANIYNYWMEKPTKLIYTSYVHLAITQEYLYILNNQTMSLQIYKLPLAATPFKQNTLVNLPKNQQIFNYLIDEKLQFLWILFKDIHYQLYICQLKTFQCYLYMNIFHFNNPIEFRINSNSQQLYLYSKDSLIIFQYNQTDIDYSIQYFNSTEDKFLTICEKTNAIEYLSINEQQICYQTCQDLPLINHIRRIEKLSSRADILYCSKQRRTSKIVLLILILIDLLLILGVIIWLGYMYISQPRLNQTEKQMNNSTIWTSEKDLVTHF